MNDKERRHSEERPQRAMLQELNDAQRSTLAMLEAYGWELKFIRHPPFQQGVPVVFDSELKKFAVLEADGSLNENPGFQIRH